MQLGSAALKLIERTLQVDLLLASLWPEIPQVALVAVGGYGRSELFPYSDIDLLFVSARVDLKEHLAPFLRALWDAGLRVSQSVHTLAECLEFNDRNVELSVSLLDRRFLLGDPKLFRQLRDPAKERLIPALARLTRDRHAKHGNTIYHLEPNIKEGPGTLRDLQVLRWMAQLDGGGSPALDHELLFLIRQLLHESARRDQNVLNYSMQDTCAPQLGFSDAPELMRAYYRQAAPLYRACLRCLDQAESRRSQLLTTLRDRAARLSNSEFSVIGGRIYLRSPAFDAAGALRLFAFIARHGLPLAADTEDRIRQLATVTASWPELRLILSLSHASLAVRTMQETAFLFKLFPDLLLIESLVVRDFYHRYTVDEHTLVTVKTAAKLLDMEDNFGDLSRETPDYALLLLALLFHDSGKGVPSRDHSEESVVIASRACQALGVSEKETETVLFLIRSHLEMSRLMLTRDLSDPGTAASLAHTVKTLEGLKLLTLLTFSDISAVNPEAMTPWRGTLLWRLYLVTARHLTRALQTEIADEGMPARYALTHSAAEIAAHHEMEAQGRLTSVERIEGAYRLTVVAPDQPASFARIAGALAGFGMNILRAEAFINERRTAVETFCFADPMRTLELNPTERDRLEQIVCESILGKRNVEEVLRARGRRTPANRVAARVSFDNAASPNATLFEITAEDRPGLLFDLTGLIAQRGCNIEVVLVDTEGLKAIDVFYVTRDRKPLSDETAGALSEALRMVAA